MNKCRLFVIILILSLRTAGYARSGFVAFNARTAKRHTSHDYHLSAGLQGVAPVKALRLKYERQEGELYRGLSLTTDKTKFTLQNPVFELLSGIYASFRFDEATENELYIFKEHFNIIDVFSLRSANRWESGVYQGVSLGAVFTGKRLAISYDTDFHGLHLFTATYRHRYDLKRGYIAPTIRYRSEPENFEAGIEYGFRL